MDITRYEIKAEGLQEGLKIAVASDLHGEDGEKAVRSLGSEAPDLILMPGDIFDFMPSVEREKRKRERSMRFLEETGKIAPCFLSVGNHEWIADGVLKEILSERNVVLLDDSFTEFRNGRGRILIGGLTSPCGREGRYNRWHTQAPDTGFLKRFAEEPGYRILLSHHPEFYPAYIRELPIDLVVSGHAHGGQIRLFGRGLFAPGQGIFPGLTEGVHENRLVISRGLGNGTPFPRIFDPRELLYIELVP